MSTILNETQRKLERPDYNIIARFESRPVEDRGASDEAHHTVYVDEDFVTISPKGERGEDGSTEHKVRLLRKKDPALWAFIEPGYKRWKEGITGELIDGTPLRHQAWISPAECLNLANLGVLSVEDLANMGDDQVGRERGTFKLREKARAALLAMKDNGEAIHKISSLTQENADLKARQDAQDAIINDLKGQVAGLLEATKRQAAE